MDNDNTIVAGRNPVMEAIKSDVIISRILIAKGQREGSINAIIALAKKKNILVKTVSPAKLDSLYTDGSHQGVVAFISPIKFVKVDDILDNAREKEEDPFVVILDGIEDVHNLGAIARTAEACGAHGMIIQKHRAAPVTPIAVKASAGALLHLPVALVTNINREIDYLKTQGVWVAGTHQDARDTYYNANLKGAMAIVIGSEGKGMSRLVSEKCDFTVSIPMVGKMSSLNASNAAAVVLFEVLKQRSES